MEKLWRYAVAGNIKKTHIDENGVLRYGTSAFKGNTKVYISGQLWDESDEELPMKTKLSPKNFYQKLYKMLEDVTPLEIDCGRLCGGACCVVTDGVTGMYLFPGERVMYEPMPQWGEIQDIDFTYGDGKSVDFFTCVGKSDRKLRPLSCRIFPLVPYVKKGEKLRIIMDIRGRGMCPLATAMKIEDLSPLFVERVTKAMKLCMLNKETREFIYSLSQSIDEITKMEEEFK